MKLYEIEQGLRALIEGTLEKIVDMETGEVVTVDNLENLQLVKEEKLEGCAVVYKELKADAEALANEIKTLQERKARLVKKQDWLADYMSAALNGEKLKTAKCSISYRKSESVELVGELTDVPAEYCRTKVELDKTAVKKAIKEGNEVNGCRLVAKQTVQIK